MGVQRKTSKRKQTTPEFKREAVRLVTEGGLSMAQVGVTTGKGNYCPLRNCRARILSVKSFSKLI